MSEASTGLTAQAQAIADQYLAAPALTPAAVPVQRSQEERTVLILELLEEGQSTRAVARVVGCSHVAVWKLAQRLELNTEIARKLLSAKASKAIEAWDKALDKGAERGDHRPAKDLLLHTQVIEPLADKASTAQVGVQVIIGMPGAPAGPDPLGAKVITSCTTDGANAQIIE